MVEHFTRNEGVPGSSPGFSSAVVIVTFVTYAADAVNEKSSDNRVAINNFFID